MRSLLLVLLSIMIGSVAGAEVTLQAPESVSAGTDFKVTWSGTGDPRDFITIVPVEKKEGGYGRYQYAKKNILDFTAPDDPGEYELRYLAKDHLYETLARVALRITAVTATIKVAGAVDAGSEFLIEWTGPDHSKDFITIIEAGAEERKYGKYVYTRKGNPAKLRAPDQAGAYEVRYLTGQRYYTLASAPITVGATGASLEAPVSVQAGATVDVTWTGPDNAQDWIAIAEAGSSTLEYKTYGYTREGSPVTIQVPDDPGSYEIRYLTGQSYTLLASIPLEVTATGATLSAPAEVRGGDLFSVEWTGPDHPRDYIGMVVAGSDRKVGHAAYAYTHKGNPATMTAPLEPGEYELRYETGQSAKILVRVPVRVTPPATEPGTPFAFRVFGHKEKDSCRTDLEIALQPLDVTAAVSTIGAIQAMNLAKTPIARSLELVA